MQITAFVVVATFLPVVAWIGWSIATTPTVPQGNEESSTNPPVVDAKLEGVVHIVGDRKMSVYELARMTADDVKPMTLAEYIGHR